QVIAVAPGRTRLVVVDSGGLDIDGTALTVARTHHLGLALDHGAAYLASGTGGTVAQEIWDVPAGEPVDLRVRPYDLRDAEIMGKLSVGTEIDEPLYTALQPSAHLEEGELDLRPMAEGDYGVVFTGADGLVLDAQLRVR